MNTRPGPNPVPPPRVSVVIDREGDVEISWLTEPMLRVAEALDGRNDDRATREVFTGENTEQTPRRKDR